MAGAFLPWQTVAPATAEALATDRETEELSFAELETLYRIRRPDVIRFLVRYGVDAVEAEDITQEVFLNAFDQPKKRPDNLFHWALVCARNLAVNRYKRGKREILAPMESWTFWKDTLVDKRVNQEARFYRKERHVRLVRAFSQLTSVEQQCLILRSKGITFRETAKALDISIHSAIYSTEAAITKLQRKLESLKR